MGIIARQTIKGTIATYIGVAIGFVTTFFIITSYLTPEEVGLTRVLVDAATLFSSLALMGTGSSTLRFYPHFKDESRNQQGLYFWTLIVPFIGFLLFLICFFAFKELIIRAFEDKSPLFVNYVYFTLPMAFFILYMSVFETNATILERVAVPRMIREVFIRVGLLVGYLLYGLWHVIDLDGLVIVFCATYGLGALLNLCYLLFSQKISFKPDFSKITPELRRDFLWYTLFLITAALVGSVMPTLSSFFISAKMGLMFTGIYAIANYIATMVEIPSRSLNAIVQPRIAVALRTSPPDVSAATRLYQQVSINQLLIGMVVLILIWINIDLFFDLLPNGDQYAAGKWVVLILALSKLVTTAFGVGCSSLSYTRWYYTSLFFTLFLVVLSICLNNYLIPICGIEGGAWATLGSNAIYVAILLLYIKWRVGTYPVSWGQLKVVAVGLLMIVLNHLIVFAVGKIVPEPSLAFRIMEAIVRTGIVSVVGLLVVYYGKVSADVNRLIRKGVREVRR
jgi:Membrane protein involved in the export of O-antigen and teichoic acid